VKIIACIEDAAVIKKICWIFIDSVEPTACRADGHPGIRQKIAVLSASAIKKAVPVRPARRPNSITRAPAAVHLAPA
jgi:hypothetical protein